MGLDPFNPPIAPVPRLDDGRSTFRGQSSRSTSSSLSSRCGPGIVHGGPDSESIQRNAPSLAKSGLGASVRFGGLGR